MSNFSFLWERQPGVSQRALKNTVILTVIQTVLVFPVPLVLALLLNSLAGERLKRLLQSILYLPHFLSWVIVVALFQQMLGNAGMLNTFLVQNDLPIVQIIGVPELFKALITSQVDLEGRRLGDDHLPGRHLAHRPGAVRGRRRGRRKCLAAAGAHHACRPSRACSSCC